MLKRNKKTIVFTLILLISFSSASYFIPKTESIDPFFTLVAKCFTPTQMDIMLLIKQQIARVGINLDVIKVDMPDDDTTKIRNYDLTIMEFNNETIVDFEQYQINDPFFADFYSENGSINVSGYDTGIDWDEELGTGKNEWFIQTGLQLTPNDSQERINLCWEWQHYMMDKILPCLPLFIHKDDNSSLQLLVFNMREVRPVIGNRDPAPGDPTISIGLLVRKAISYAINREEIRRVVLGDEYEIIHHSIDPALEEWLNPNSIRYCYNLDFARKLMTLGSPGVGFGGDGEHFEYPDWEDICNENPTSVSVIGFDLIITLGVLLAYPISIGIYRKQKKKRNLE